MIWVVLTPIVVCLLISILSTSILYKVVFLSLGIFIAVTLGLNYINNLLRDSINKSKELSNTKTMKGDKFKSRIVENKDYIELVTILKSFMKNKILSREQILDFKEQVNNHLGESKNHYKFKFDNDLHEIYSKLKNKSLKSSDYAELLQVLNNYKTN